MRAYGIMAVSSSTRALIERATKSWSYRRCLPAAFHSAPIVVSPSAGLKYLFKPMTRVDPSLLRNAAELVRPGDVVWDIGANIGLFSIAAAALAGPTGSVFAFEPDISLVQLMHRSRQMQPATSAPVTIVPVAVASEIALRQLMIARRSRASNALAGYSGSQTGGIADEHATPAFNLDWLLTALKPPNVVKCDVEGAEIEIFRGQKRFLRDVRAVSVCEVGDEGSAEITQLFRAEGYRLFDGDQTLRGASEIGQAVWNTVAVPEEKLSMYNLG
jgi:FkbM family methyltransferase